MLTRLRVQGFKNLLDVDVRFGPFTCVAGPNGVGKSNLFDAIRFLHLLTQYPIMEAVQHLRETQDKSLEPRSLFTSFERYTAPEMRFTAELLVNRETEDDFGVPAKASIATLEYELAFKLDVEDGVERLVLIFERLDHVTLSEAKRRLGFERESAFTKSCVTGRHTGHFISTSINEDTGEPIIRVHQEGHGGRLLPAPKSSRTVIGGMASSDYPTVLAAHREMQSWRALLLEPSAMRAPSRYRDERVISSRGGNLPGAISRLQRNEKHRGSTCAELANRVADLIEDVQELRIRDDEKTETLTLEVRGRDGVFHPARALSDGTLRFLVLATLAQDPNVQGVLCLEEPENGIHPERVPAMVELLKDIAVDASLAVDADNPLRQVIVNTHSPQVVQQVDSKQNMLFVDEERVEQNGNRGRVALFGASKGSWRTSGDNACGVVAYAKMLPYWTPPEGVQMVLPWPQDTQTAP